MTLSLKQVFEKVNSQADPRVGYIFDDPIHYVVLNNGENVFNMESMNKVESIYDEIAKTEGAGVVVTISSSAKYFSTGFDLEWWGNDEINVISGIARM